MNLIIGKLSFIHNNRFSDWIVRKYKIYRVKRIVLMAFSLFFGMWGGYMHGNTLKNLYV